MHCIQLHLINIDISQNQLRINMIKVFRKSLTINFCKAKINKPLVDYKQRGQFRSPLQLKVGDTIEQFEVLHRQKYPDFEIDSAVLKCKKYGTKWIHLDCEQQKNSIGYIINCKQAPHSVKVSLQKMLQCGSTKYPIRNPVQFMTRRSFNPQNFGYVTNQYIFYGYQTSLMHDHKNLMQVYMHMMFDPLLRKEDFQEQVWRYDLKNPSKLQIVGDVANEMFANWNYSQTRVFDAIERELFRGGAVGNRDDLLKLRHEDLVKWHKILFTPSNLLVISHGDLHPIKLIHNFRQISYSFKWEQSKSTLFSQQLGQLNKNKKQQLQESKTLKIQHIDASVPLVLSFNLQKVSTEDRVLLSILSYLLFDMPNSTLMHWNTPQTPYPKHYGFQGNHFNIGITFQQADSKSIPDSQFLQQQKLIRDSLQQLYKNKISNFLIEQCLFHLQGQYYSRDGIKIMTGLIDSLIESGHQSMQQAFNVKSLISKTLRNYRKQNIFQQLLKKYILDNKRYIRVWGKQNYQLIEDAQFQDAVKMRLIHQRLKPEQIQEIKSYTPPNILQDYRVLPKININELQIFQEKDPKIFTVNKIPVYYTNKCDGIKIVIKYDITDIDQQQIKLIPIICESFPWMGAKGIYSQAFSSHISMYLKDISMNFQTCRSKEGMKLYLYLNVEFTDRNAQFGFNLCSNLVNDHNHGNIQVLSNRIQRKASQTFNNLTQNLVEIHGRHTGGTRSPYAMFQDPIFMARSTCSLASDILKVSNPKQILRAIAYQLKTVTSKFVQKSRISVLFQCKRENVDKYNKYIQMMLNPIKPDKIKLQHIKDKDFTPTPSLKYFPNYNEEYVFEAFSVPYYNNLDQVPATLVLSTIINQNIKQYNQSGGCFLFKGAMISYLRGSRKKLLELENYYKKIQELDEAKRFIFQQFRRYTAADIFYTGVTAEQARNFKQAVAMVDEDSVKACLQKHVLPTIKQGKSSILAIGPHLGNYQPLIKKAWVVERSVDDMSLSMESDTATLPRIEMSKYINIY